MIVLPLLSIPASSCCTRKYGARTLTRTACRSPSSGLVLDACRLGDTGVARRMSSGPRRWRGLPGQGVRTLRARAGSAPTFSALPAGPRGSPPMRRPPSFSLAADNAPATGPGCGEPPARSARPMPREAPVTRAVFRKTGDGPMVLRRWSAVDGQAGARDVARVPGPATKATSAATSSTWPYRS